MPRVRQLIEVEISPRSRGRDWECALMAGAALHPTCRTDAVVHRELGPDHSASGGRRARGRRLQSEP